MDTDKAKKVVEEGEKILKDTGLDKKISEAVKNVDSDKVDEAKSAIKDIAGKLKKD